MRAFTFVSIIVAALLLVVAMASTDVEAGVLDRPSPYLVRRDIFHRRLEHYYIMARIKWRHGLLESSESSTANNNNEEKHAVALTKNDILLATITAEKIPASQLAQLRLPRVEKAFHQPEHARLLRVAVLGRPNAGKSTLVNALVGRSVSDVAARAHTTRTRINAILTHDDTQLVFLDTPGVARLSGGRMGQTISRELQTASWRSLEAADHALLVVDAKRAAESLARKRASGRRDTNEAASSVLDREARCFDEDDHAILRQLQTSSLPVTVVFNKTDLLAGTTDALARLERLYREAVPSVQTVVFASALGNTALEDIKFTLMAAAPLHPWMFPADYSTDVSDVVRVERAVSAALYEHLRSYMAYAVRLSMVDWSEKPIVHPTYTSAISAHIHILVDKENQKRMVIGSKGELIKSVRQMAETNLGNSLRKMVRVQLEVKLV
ncbi:P-loop containing nucleoside triphosphate hydrolase protein [Syncephalis pseudoplumigaleata]|uniref:P-loop containing nucleoside triphosphate hydrolase protein n=1 Tax=Syncephalis pseudoplumigaleata TaxID=1712513 RepID=A0A4P9Z0K9_9FUNG|nr:P-loop containing nucleoside triphosphate hydrolase protein [Syncephalis pseudoplumigaleata]|eukprot:RKP25231.1 P-loop containing nucleoside triphosphate hydrolase protein [Syncephalis pseudoplumigaleata]